MTGLACVLGGRNVLDVDIALEARRAFPRLNRRDPEVISCYVVLPAPVRTGRVHPAFNRCIPNIGDLAQVCCDGRFVIQIGQIRGSQECSDFRSDRERRVAGIFLPAILWAHRAVSNQIARGSPHHRPKPGQISIGQCFFAMGQIHQENRQCRLVHLDSIPIGRSIQPHILRPVPIWQLSRLQIIEHAPCIRVRADGQQSAGRFHHVARPDQMVATQILITVARSPGDRETGDDSPGRRLGLMRAQDGEADP